MKKILAILLLALFYSQAKSQPQIGIGYGMGYYYEHLRNLDVFALEYNQTNSPKLEISNFCAGPTIELVLGGGGSGSGFLINWMMRSKTYSAGSDDVRTRITRTGIGFKFATSRFGVGVTADIGKARIQARSGSDDWSGLFSTEKDMYLGSSMFVDVYAFGRFGLRAYWLHNWIYCEFGQYENFKFNFSNVGLEVTAYLFRNGGDR